MKKLIVTVIIILSVVSTISTIAYITRKYKTMHSSDEKNKIECCDLVLDFGDVSVSDTDIHIKGDVVNSAIVDSKKCYGTKEGVYSLNCVVNGYSNICISGEINIGKDDIGSVKKAYFVTGIGYCIKANTSLSYDVNLNTNKMVGYGSGNKYYFYEPGTYNFDITGDLIEDITYSLTITEEDLNTYSDCRLLLSSEVNTINLNVVEYGKKVTFKSTYYLTTFTIYDNTRTYVNSFDVILLPKSFDLAYGTYYIKGARDGYFDREETFIVSSDMESTNFSFNDNWQITETDLVINIGQSYAQGEEITISPAPLSMSRSGNYILAHVENGETITVDIRYPGHLWKTEIIDLGGNYSSEVECSVNLVRRIGNIYVELENPQYKYWIFINPTAPGTGISGCPGVIYDIYPGTYNISITRGGYQTITGTVTLLRYGYELSYVSQWSIIESSYNLNLGSTNHILIKDSDWIINE